MKTKKEMTLFELECSRNPTGRLIVLEKKEAVIYYEVLKRAGRKFRLRPYAGKFGFYLD
jgi:hypothetical protein